MGQHRGSQHRHLGQEEARREELVQHTLAFRVRTCGNEGGCEAWYMSCVCFVLEHCPGWALLGGVVKEHNAPLHYFSYFSYRNMQA